MSPRNRQIRRRDLAVENSFRELAELAGPPPLCRQKGTTIVFGSGGSPPFGSSAAFAYPWPLRRQGRIYILYVPAPT